MRLLSVCIIFVFATATLVSEMVSSTSSEVTVAMILENHTSPPEVLSEMVSSLAFEFSELPSGCPPLTNSDLASLLQVLPHDLTSMHANIKSGSTGWGKSMYLGRMFDAQSHHHPLQANYERRVKSNPSPIIGVGMRTLLIAE